MGGSVWHAHSTPPKSRNTQAQLRNEERKDRQS
jgi:hypothetical protein